MRALACAALAGWFAFTGRKVVRWEGMLLLIGFIGFVLISYTGGLAGVIAGFPLWVVLYAGGFAPPPNAFGLWLVGVLAMLGSYLFARWRPQ